jgi:hypothetical protein
MLPSSLLIVLLIVGSASFASAFPAWVLELSPKCMKSAETFLTELGNNATLNTEQMILSSSGSLGGIGDYGQCIQNYNSQYCLITFNTSILLNKETHTFYAPQTGLCLPDHCDQKDVILISQNLIFPYLFRMGNTSASQFSDVECLKPFTLHGAGAIFIVVLTSMLCALVVFGTLRAYVLRLQHEHKAGLAASINNDEEGQGLLKDQHTKTVQQAIRKKASNSIIGAFDAITNFEDLTKSPSINQGLKSLDGLRFISMVCVAFVYLALSLEVALDYSWSHDAAL